ncbi:MBOAT family protein [Thalassotalea maritima]|uniref:MBOAT family O-acyltransferase n=1 Tax=Thalassotalea maritima TaxID=3242416 RepID=UPI00352701A6
MICSLFFYGYWRIEYLALIILSICINFALGNYLLSQVLYRKIIATLGIALNLFVILLFKYANFTVEQVNIFLEQPIHLEQIFLPLAISFFTFQQIAYLVECYRYNTPKHTFAQYMLFVTFFPQLIAGPIVQFKDIHPQITSLSTTNTSAINLATGICLFSIGLFKKTVIADSLAPYANMVFDNPDTTITLLSAWQGTLAYTFQLYFDFSGYSDMAIGLGYMFGFTLPVNFNSPYKARNISDFWRRWHITLSSFLRDYLYIPLGGNKFGQVKRYRNLLITMLLGGLWHGAGWNFILWGGLHGLYLSIHHFWRSFIERTFPALFKVRVYRTASLIVTFIVVCIAWVFFRSHDLNTATSILMGMFGANGVAIPNAIYVRLPLNELIQSMGITTYLGGGSNFVKAWGLIIIATIIAIGAPNSNQIIAKLTSQTAHGSYLLDFRIGALSSMH